MKRKLRIFSNIAIICLSVCMFAFGVYAASTVSVTTSGTVSFQATGVYAEITRTITGANNAPSATSVTIDSSASDNDEYPMNADLEFASGDSLVEIKFEIENKATEDGRYIYATVTAGTLVNNNVKQVAEYLNTEIMISPNSSRTISIYLFVQDVNMSASATYDYNIALKSSSAGTVLTENDVELEDNYDGTYAITRINSTASHITIPEKIGEYTISSIGSSMSYSSDANIFNDNIGYNGTGNATLKHLTMANSITGIYSYAFYGCKELEYIGFSQNITTLTGECFGGNEKLYNKVKSIVLPVVNEQEYFIVSNCLETLIMPEVGRMYDGIVYNSGYSCSIKTLIYKGSLSSWDTKEINEGTNYCFMAPNDSNLFIEGQRMVDITLSAERINTGKYTYCQSIRSVTFTDSVQTIGAYAFHVCSNLTLVTIPTSVTKIEDCAFYTQSSLIINYLGTKTQFKAIDIASSGIDSMIVAHCTDGDITYEEYYGY